MNQIQHETSVKKIKYFVESFLKSYMKAVDVIAPDHTLAGKYI